MKCPKCRHYLEDGTESHVACGWGVAIPEPDKPIDAAELAARSAARQQPEAIQTCERLGLKTVEEMRAWVRGKVKLKRFPDASEAEVEAKREIARKVAYGGGA